MKHVQLPGPLGPLEPLGAPQLHHINLAADLHAALLRFGL